MAVVSASTDAASWLAADLLLRWGQGSENDKNLPGVGARYVDRPWLVMLLCLCRVLFLEGGQCKMTLSPTLACHVAASVMQDFQFP